MTLDESDVPGTEIAKNLSKWDSAQFMYHKHASEWYDTAAEKESIWDTLLGKFTSPHFAELIEHEKERVDNLVWMQDASGLGLPKEVWNWWPIHNSDNNKWLVKYGIIGSSPHSVYDQEVTVFDAYGNILGIFEGSSIANPFKPREPSITGIDAYPQVEKGTYDLAHGLHKGKPALSVNNDGFVPTTAPNPNFPAQGSKANLIRVHIGYSDTWKGSAGCMTINPTQWDKFLETVPSSGSGLLIVP